jgi:hypothetical protein
LRDSKIGGRGAEGGSVGGLALGVFKEATAEAADHLFAYEGGYGVGIKEVEVRWMKSRGKRGVGGRLEVGVLVGSRSACPRRGKRRMTWGAGIEEWGRGSGWE